MGISLEAQKDYLDAEAKRAGSYLRPLEILFAEARDDVTNDTLAFFNSRRYLNAKDSNARARAARSDKGIKSISAKINKLGRDSLNIIYKAQPDSYNREGVILIDLWNETSPDGVEMTFQKADKAKTKQLISEYYDGLQYVEWERKGYTATAMKDWNRNSRSIMSSNVRLVGKVAPNVQLTSSLRQSLQTMETRSKSLMDGALSQTNRILISDVQTATLKAEQSIAKALDRRVIRWL